MKNAVFVILKPLLYLISLLPFAAIYLLSDFLYVFFYYGLKYRREVVYQNLRNSFPEKTEEEITTVAKEFYHFLCDQLLESIKMLTISEQTVKKRFRLNNIEEIHRHFDNNKSVIAVTGHYGNWEWGGLILSILVRGQVIIVYKPINDKRFENLVNKMRSRFNAVLVPMKNTLRKIIQYKDEKYLAVLVSDQTPARSEINYYTRFMNQWTPVFLGVEKLAKLTHDSVIYCHINRYKRGFYECTFETLIEQPELTAEREITESFTKKLEQIIRQKPELWLWSHRRWKYSDTVTS